MFSSGSSFLKWDDAPCDIYFCSFSRFLKWVNTCYDIFFVVFPGSWSGLTPPVIYIFDAFTGFWSGMTPPVIYIFVVVPGFWSGMTPPVISTVSVTSWRFVRSSRGRYSRVGGPRPTPKPPTPRIHHNPPQTSAIQGASKVLIVAIIMWDNLHIFAYITTFD